MGFDLDPQASLARHLAGHGYDVWCLELRGHGLSDHPSLFGPRRYGWSFDDYLRLDLPAALDRVLEETGQDAVHYLGHSMGGVLLYSHLASEATPRIRSGIAVGSSLDYSGTGSEFAGLVPYLGLTKVLPAIPLGPLAAATAPLAGRVPNRLEEFNTWPDNVEPRLVRRLNASTFHPVSSPVLVQLATAFEPGGLASFDGSLRYLDGLPRASTPVLALAGDRDRQCPPRAAQVPIDALGSATKRLEVFGRDHGHPEHYGHFDLLMGRRAASETWPAISGWFDDHDE